MEVDAHKSQKLGLGNAFLSRFRHDSGGDAMTQPIRYHPSSAVNFCWNAVNRGYSNCRLYGLITRAKKSLYSAKKDICDAFPKSDPPGPKTLGYKWAIVIMASNGIRNPPVSAAGRC